MLTEQQIRDMEPGRELDELVGEKVMGWSKQGDFYGRTGEFGPPVIEWNPSTDISAAWEVVEKSEKEVTVKRFLAMSGWKYWCRISSDEPGVFDETIAHGKTAAEAIVKCALIAILRGGSGE